MNALLVQYPAPDESQDGYRPYYAEMDATPQGRDTGRPGVFASAGELLALLGWGVVLMALVSAVLLGGIVALDMVLTGIATAAEAREVAKW